MFISNAYAAGTAAGGSMFSSLVPIIIMFGIVYLLLIRPQMKQMRAHQELVSNLKKGNKVCTTGGVVGYITKTDEETVEVENPDGSKFEVMRNDVRLVLEERAKKATKTTVKKTTKTTKTASTKTEKKPVKTTAKK